MLPMDLKYQLLIIIILYSVNMSTSVFEFTNIKCTSLDKKFDNFEYCHLKSVNRTFKYVSIKVNMYVLPVTNVKVNFSLLKKFSGYKPFLYNITADACRVLKYPKFNPVVGFFYSIFSHHSNMNHTCPYNHDIIVDKLPADFVNTKITKTLPFPVGDYLFDSKWIINNVNRAEVKVYGTLTNSNEL